MTELKQGLDQYYLDLPREKNPRLPRYLQRQYFHQLLIRCAEQPNRSNEEELLQISCKELLRICRQKRHGTAVIREVSSNSKQEQWILHYRENVRDIYQHAPFDPILKDIHFALESRTKMGHPHVCQFLISILECTLENLWIGAHPLSSNLR